MLNRSLIIAMCLLPVACTDDMPTLTEDSVAIAVPQTHGEACVAPETMDYRVDESMTQLGANLAVGGVDVINDFAYEVLGREVLTYQGRAPHWVPGTKLEGVVIQTTRDDAEFKKFLELHPECVSKNPAGCGLYHEAAFVHADRLRQRFTGKELEDLLAYVTAHEIGHVLLGGGHLPNGDSLMDGIAELEQPSMNASDKGWFCRKYCCNDQYPVIEEAK